MQKIDQKSEPIAQVILAYFPTYPKTPSTVNKSCLAYSLLGESYKIYLDPAHTRQTPQKNGPS